MPSPSYIPKILIPYIDDLYHPNLSCFPFFENFCQKNLGLQECYNCGYLFKEKTMTLRDKDHYKSIMNNYIDALKKFRIEQMIPNVRFWGFKKYIMDSRSPLWSDKNCLNVMRQVVTPSLSDTSSCFRIYRDLISHYYSIFLHNENTMSEDGKEYIPPLIRAHLHEIMLLDSGKRVIEALLKKTTPFICEVHLDRALSKFFSDEKDIFFLRCNKCELEYLNLEANDKKGIEESIDYVREAIENTPFYDGELYEKLGEVAVTLKGIREDSKEQNRALVKVMENQTQFFKEALEKQNVLFKEMLEIVTKKRKNEE